MDSCMQCSPLSASLEKIWVALRGEVADLPGVIFVVVKFNKVNARKSAWVPGADRQAVSGGMKKKTHEHR